MTRSDLQSSVDVINKLSFADKSDDIFEELTNAFRRLRNISAEGCRIQNEITSDGAILYSTHRILNEILSIEDRNDSINFCLVVGLQFVANLLVGNSETQKIVWQSYQNLLKSCLKLRNSKVQNCAAMILYNIFLGHPEYMSPEKDVIENLISLTTNEKSSEFAIYLLQLYLKNTHYIQELYNLLKPDLKLIVIEAVQDLIGTSDGNFNTELIRFFVKKFLMYSDAVINILDNSECSFEAYEIVKVLEFLASICDNENNLKILQSEMLLLINCSVLLENIHALSKEPDNMFSVIQKLSELNEIEKNSDVQNHPYFGFKCSLIRLIGNFCWKNSECQNKVRELGIIPVLLDCCNVDGRNPFIIQWAILAIRNVCHNNKENQKSIADLSKVGMIDTEKLEKLGILLNKNSDGSSLSISPLVFKK